MNKTLDKLKANNPNVEIEDIKGYYIINKLWNDPSFQIKIPKTKKIEILSEIKLPEQLVGVYHFKKTKIRIFLWY